MRQSCKNLTRRQEGVVGIIPHGVTGGGANTFTEMFCVFSVDGG